MTDTDRPSKDEAHKNAFLTLLDGLDKATASVRDVLLGTL